MTEFNQFHVRLSPNIQNTDTWDVLLEECPRTEFEGRIGSIQPVITPQQLTTLRSRHGWPNSEMMRSIGESVWNSMMTPIISAAFEVSLTDSINANKGLRFLVSLVGEEPGGAALAGIRLQELPLEALFSTTNSFVAFDQMTPVSRSLRFKPDRDPHPVVPPLRVLVVVATPQDKPPAKQLDEKKAIEEAIENLTTAGAVELEFCNPPTRQELKIRLGQQQPFHVLHFIGHGAFAPVGQDPTPLPHLCFEDPTTGDSDPVDAETLVSTLLKNSGVRLVVITACSSASPSPAQVWDTIGPFGGVAQALVSRDSGVNAVVAMQFDLESNAAVAFSNEFYTRLLAPDNKLDEIVSFCRQAIANKMGSVGHRAWVTPVVYWRCKDGKVFEIVDKALDPQIEREVAAIKGAIGAYVESIPLAKEAFVGMANEARTFIAGTHGKIEELQQKWSRLLGETIRIHGDVVAAGQSIQCPVKLSLQTMAEIGDVNVQVLFPSDKVEYKSVSAGGNLIHGNAPAVAIPVPGELRLVLQNVSQGAQWPPGEYELALLTFSVHAEVTDHTMELSLADAKVKKNGVETSLDSLDALLFVV